MLLLTELLAPVDREPVGEALTVLLLLRVEEGVLPAVALPVCVGLTVPLTLPD